MTYGFDFWRSGFRASTPWIYQAVIGDPWNYLDGSAMDFFNRTDDVARAELKYVRDNIDGQEKYKYDGLWHGASSMPSAG